MNGPAVSIVLAGIAFGAIAGSFLATLIVRWPQGRKISAGRSACDRCGRTLGIADLVPLASVLVLRGRCSGCGQAIDPVHWQVELACAVVGGLVAALAPAGVGMAGWMLLGWVLVMLAFLDARHFWLPDALTLPLLVSGLVAAPLVTGTDRLDAIIGAAAGGATLWGIAIAYRRLAGREGLGLGDAKLFAAIGAWFGWQSLPIVMSAAAISGLMWAVLVVVARGQAPRATARVPLGTFLCLAAVPGWWASGILLAP